MSQTVAPVGRNVCSHVISPQGPIPGEGINGIHTVDSRCEMCNAKNCPIYSYYYDDIIPICQDFAINTLISISALYIMQTHREMIAAD